MLAKLIVTVLGVLLIVLVNWYFFFSRRKSASADVKERGSQEIKTVVKRG